MLHNHTRTSLADLPILKDRLRVSNPFWGLTHRFTVLIVLFLLELIVISIWLDTSALDGKSGLMGAVGDWGPYVLQSLIALTTVLLALGYSNAKDALAPISNRLADTPPAWRFLASHGAAMGLFAVLSSLLFGGRDPGGNLLVLAWLAAGICGIATGVAFFIPPKPLRELVGSAGTAWIYAIAAALVTPYISAGCKIDQ